MGLGEIFELQMWQDYYADPLECLNVFFFRQNTVTGSAVTLLDGFEADLLPKILDIQCDGLATRLIKVRSLWDVGNFEQRSYTATEFNGNWVQDSLPVHDSTTLRLVTNTREVRNGSKRFAGVPEPAQDNGLYVDVDFLESLDALRVAMVEPVRAGLAGVDQFDQVVVKRIRLEPDAEHPKVRYRLPMTPEETVYMQPSACLANVFVTHQISRKS